jgi:hypothetical protein
MMGNEWNRPNAVSRAALPSAAQRWLDTALPADLELASRVRIEQQGTMDVRGSWKPFTATGIYEVAPLSFTWRAAVRMWPAVWILAEDGHKGCEGWGGARLWGIVPLGWATGAEVLAAQWVRNLAELAWLPSFVLLDRSLRWAASAEGGFEVRGTAGEREVVVRFELNEQGDIERAYSPARPYDVPGGFAEAPWHVQFSDHREFGGVRIPAAAVATFEKDDGAWEHLRCRITQVTPEAIAH